MSMLAAIPLYHGRQRDYLPSIIGGNTQNEYGFDLNIVRTQTPSSERKALRSIQSFASTVTLKIAKHEMLSLQPGNVTTSGQEEPRPLVVQEKHASSTVRAESPVEQHHARDAPARPGQQTLSTTRHDIQNEEKDDADSSDNEESGGEDDYDGSGRSKQTAEHSRPGKRRMKRFRLTHNQTRFLMGEFARQAHPDAAQRERLSKERPGLSPRQVQVWFQNRRAKLKRLTADDREKMMKSRALPENFDMQQALHSPFHAGHQQVYVNQYGAPSIPPPAQYNPSHYGPSSLGRESSIVDIQRQINYGHSNSPIGMPADFNTYYAASGSRESTGNMSAVSPSIERSTIQGPLFHQSQGRLSQYNTPQTSGFSSSIPRRAQRIQGGDDRLTSPRSDTVGSPLRSSMSYGQMYGFAAHTTEEAVSTPSSNTRLASRDPATNPSPYLQSRLPTHLDPRSPPAIVPHMRTNPTSSPTVDQQSPYSRLSYSYQPSSNIGSEPERESNVTMQQLGLSQLRNEAGVAIQGSIRSPSLDYPTQAPSATQAFQRSSQLGLYGASYQANSAQGGSDYGVSSPSIKAGLEPEMYYKTEHEGREYRPNLHFSPPLHIPQQQIQRPMFPTPTQIDSPYIAQATQEQQSQHPIQLLASSQATDRKRRRDTADEGEAIRVGESDQVIRARQRRRTLTIPEEYRLRTETKHPPT